ncbi:hypothetical protein CWI39_0156p0020 [Hamiltosporidium magnivora]|uniref:Uncharacterized protein n=1 Tax=Hamiltosporidium magnivora TaxID=148818 RepID=A0A4Q9LHY0_9MICR|nr:hypothetical protein CWI36_0241p0020 [Hamiltosporidium magnivora]TBU08643.1 hypothetical protein CWI39_0156p0020 [Hamiltosporidium magnivora]
MIQCEISVSKNNIAGFISSSEIKLNKKEFSSEESIKLQIIKFQILGKFTVGEDITIFLQSIPLPILVNDIIKLPITYNIEFILPENSPPSIYTTCFSVTYEISIEILDFSNISYIFRNCFAVSTQKIINLEFFFSNLLIVPHNMIRIVGKGPSTIAKAIKNLRYLEFADEDKDIKDIIDKIKQLNFIETIKNDYINSLNKFDNDLVLLQQYTIQPDISRDKKRFFVTKNDNKICEIEINKLHFKDDYIKFKINYIVNIKITKIEIYRNILSSIGNNIHEKIEDDTIYSDSCLYCEWKGAIDHKYIFDIKCYDFVVSHFISFEFDSFKIQIPMVILKNSK